MSQKSACTLANASSTFMMKLNRAKELPGYWNSDIYIVKLALVNTHFSQAAPMFNLDLTKVQD